MSKYKHNILIVDDEKKICNILREILEDEGYIVDVCFNGADAEKVIKSNDIALVLLDLKLPDINGITLLKKLKQIKPEVSVVMISAFGTISRAVEAVKAGADDFIEKPLETARVLTTIKNTLEKSELKRETIRLKSKIEDKYKLIGKSQRIKDIYSVINKVAPTNAAVLILGESGTGKEHVAHLIHNRSGRARKPFIKVNCAAIPGELIESELFGFEKGAFTGASRKKQGQFELADSGTLFLDEIGDMSLKAQAKVLRAIEENKVQRIGAKKPFDIDVRIIAATNKNLSKLLEEKRFRDDLYHRLNVISITVPPLRERKEDIPILAEYFMKKTRIENNIPLKKFTDSGIKYLSNQIWDGNVRELKHVVEKICILSEEVEINSEEISNVMNSLKSQISPLDQDFNEAKKNFERNYIISILNSTGWKIGETADILKIDRTSLFRKMKKLGIGK